MEPLSILRATRSQLARSKRLLAPVASISIAAEAVSEAIFDRHGHKARIHRSQIDQALRGDREQPINSIAHLQSSCQSKEAPYAAISRGNSSGQIVTPVAASIRSEPGPRRSTNRRQNSVRVWLSR